MKPVRMVLTHRLTIFAAGLGAGWLAANAFREPPPAPVVTAPARTVVAVPAASLTAIESVAAKALPDATAGMPEDALPSPPPLPAAPEPLVVKPAQTSDEASALMEAILRLPDDAERVALWQEMLAQMTPENFAFYHDAWRLGSRAAGRRTRRACSTTGGRGNWPGRKWSASATAMGRRT